MIAARFSYAFLGLVLSCTFGAAAGAPGCSNPYFPSTTGASWSYHIDGAKGGAYTTRIVASDAHGFIERRTGLVPMTLHWRCGRDGWRLPAFDVLGTLPLRAAGFAMRASDLVGAILPAPGAWKSGYSWSYRFDFSSQSGAGAAGAEMTGIVTVDNRLTGVTRVSVPAGRFDAFEVRSQIHVDATEHVMGQSVPVHTSAPSRAYYASGVGLVRIDGKGRTTLLTGFTP